MATLADTPRTQTFTLASATAGPFSVTLRLFSTDLRVTVNDVATEAYSVTATFADGYEDDATITFDEALEIGDVVVIDPILPPARDTSWSPTEPDLTKKLNIELARSWSVLQQFLRDFTRSLKLPSNATQSKEIAAPTAANQIFSSNSDNTGFVFGPATTVDLANAEANATAAASSASAAAASAASAALYDGPWRDDVQALLDDETLTYTAGQVGTVTTGDIIRTRAEGFAYEVAASGATDQHVTTAGGVKLYVLPNNRGYNVKAFGAIGDGVTDDSAIVEKAIFAAYNSATLDGGKRRGACVYIPKGRYRIAQSDFLFSTLPTVTGGAGSFHFSGDGPNDSYASDVGASIIAFDPPTDATSEHLINNASKITFSKFSGIGFVSDNGGTFWNGPDGDGVQSFEFRDCGFTGFTDLFNIGATTNNSEWSFFQCKFSRFSGRAFYLNNEQAVNWRFFGCDAEVFSGALFEFNKGANVSWVTGSIIPTDSAARIVRVPSGAASIGANNEPQVKFSDVRFEMREGALMLEKIEATQNFKIVFEDCNMGGFGIPTSPSVPRVLYWRGSGLVSFIRCRNMQKFRWDYSTSGNGTEGAAQLNVVLRGCDIDDNFLDGSLFVLSPGASNGGRHPVFDVEGCGQKFNGVYRPEGQNLSGVSGKARSISFTVENDKIAILGVGAGWPNVQTINLPPVYLSRLSHHPVATASFGSSTATLTLKNASGDTLWTRTYTMNSGALAPEEVLLAQKISPDDPFVTLEFSSSYVGAVAVPFLGALFLHY